MVTANTLQVMRVAEDNKIPLIAPAATGDRLLDKKYILLEYVLWIVFKVHL